MTPTVRRGSTVARAFLGAICAVCTTAAAGPLEGLEGATSLALGSLDRSSVERFAGLASVTGEYYEGGHWLGSFATYLVFGKGR